MLDENGNYNIDKPLMNFTGYYSNTKNIFNSLVYETYDDLLRDYDSYGHTFIINKYYNFILDYKKKKLTPIELKNEFNIFKNLMHIKNSYILDFIMLEWTHNTKFYKIYKSIFGEMTNPIISENSDKILRKNI